MNRRLQNFKEQLYEANYSGDFLDDEATKVAYSTDNSIYQLVPQAVLVPSSAADVASLARINSMQATPFALVARGGGTGTNGQSLTDQLVIDTKRSLNQIVSIDAMNKQAIVQPGVVLTQLNEALHEHGLFFAPHVSTASRATIGGMVATDAAGKGSMRYGRTNDHVIALNVVLSDGTQTRFASPDEPPDTDQLGQRMDAELQEILTTTDFSTLPQLSRGFTGYNIERAASRLPVAIDYTKLLCGSEGTLAITTAITIKLTDLPKQTHLAVVVYPTFLEAIDDATRLKSTQPIAIECIDDTTMRAAQRSSSWPQVKRFVGGETKPVLLIEYDDIEKCEHLAELTTERQRHVAYTSDSDEIAALWQLRKDAVGLVAKPLDGAAPVAFVEDCAVPPQHLSAFISGFRDVLERNSVRYAMYGHADVGCVHVRPALNLEKSEHQKLVRKITDEVTELVTNYGGVLWGEHGRGFRGAQNSLDAQTLLVMRKIKTLFDSNNILNPHKLYTPITEKTEPSEVTALDDVPLRAQSNVLVSIDERQRFESAFSCNGNGICHHWGPTEVMCPSFKTTNDPRLSPKGRADMFRAHAVDPTNEMLADDVAESLDQCLSCSACLGRCPVQVDISEMKSTFLATRKRTVIDNVRVQAISRFESVVPLAAKLPSWLQKTGYPLLRYGLQLVDMPIVAGPTLAQLAKQEGVAYGNENLADASVLILPDAFTAFFEPSVLRSVIRLLKTLGETPAIATYVASGKFDHVKGLRGRFAQQVAKQRAHIEQLAGLGVPMLVIEPAVASLYTHEYRAFDAQFPEIDVTISTYVVQHKNSASLQSFSTGQSVDLFTHCTETTLHPQNTRAYAQLLEQAGFTVQTHELTCCGMAGIFGHEKANQTMSKELFESCWLPLINQSKANYLVAPGYSCRSQAKRFDTTLTHPLSLMASLHAIAV